MVVCLCCLRVVLQLNDYGFVSVTSSCNKFLQAKVTKKQHGQLAQLRERTHFWSDLQLSSAPDRLSPFIIAEVRERPLTHKCYALLHRMAAQEEARILLHTLELLQRRYLPW